MSMWFLDVRHTRVTCKIWQIAKVCLRKWEFAYLTIFVFDVFEIVNSIILIIWKLLPFMSWNDNWLATGSIKKRSRCLAVDLREKRCQISSTNSQGTFMEISHLKLVNFWNYFLSSTFCEDVLQILHVRLALNFLSEIFVGMNQNKR